MKARQLAIPILTGLLLITPLYSATRAEVRAAQEALSDKGYDPGPADGLMGPRTRGAARAFQRDQGLAVTGQLDDRTLVALGVKDTIEEEMPAEVTIPRGTRIAVILNDSLSSKDADAGDGFSMTSVGDLVVDGWVAIPARSRVWGVVREVERAKRPQKGGKLVLGARSAVVSGDSVALSGQITAQNEKMKGKGSLKGDLKKIGVAAGVGGRGGRFDWRRQRRGSWNRNRRRGNISRHQRRTCQLTCRDAPDRRINPERPPYPCAELAGRHVM